MSVTQISSGLVGTSSFIRLGISAQTMTREGGALVTHAPADQKTSIAHDVEQAVAAHIHAKVAPSITFSLRTPTLGWRLRIWRTASNIAVYLNRRLVAAPEALVICLSCVAKQSAGVIRRHAGMELAQAAHCLAPDFFLIGILNSFSAMSIMISRPRHGARHAREPCEDGRSPARAFQPYACSCRCLSSFHFR